ncbi:MAG TPA: alpha-mannosidase [Roseiflexaceae bacterium]|nr:alpha-mannosidase [Roseiflexaceae bacterium]
MPSLLTAEKLRRRIIDMDAWGDPRRSPSIFAAAVRDTRPIDEVFTCPAPGAPPENAMAPPPPPDHPAWRPLRRGEVWGGDPHNPDKPEVRIPWGMPADGGHNHWLRATLRVPPEWRGQTVRLLMQWEGSGQASVESILYIDGQAVAGIDEPHPAAILPAWTHEGEHEVLIRAYAPYRHPFGGLSLELRDDDIFQLACTMYAAFGAAETMRDSDPQKHALIDRVNRAYNLLDLSEGWSSERFAQTARAALVFLRETLTLGLAGGVRPTLLATGHAHMDVAWLWPLWRTRQKIAHTVATALNLMERYPEYYFSMSQPQTYTFLKQDDPQLYARLRQRVAEGRFEPVGMMWVEPDCNVPSGESLARQLTHGARFFEEEFGAINHVVWLPDVFGYSAALPQLMRLAGISCFMTTKISWNQFNRMPYDTFRWRGIDGSEVLAHFVTATDQPVKPNPSEAQFYTYNGQMLPAEVFGTWNHYRQKAVSDEVLYIYGFGDGGGGPTEEMLELARQMADLPGFPQVRPGRVEQFFERLYQRAWDHPQTPTWVGELYLEFHRGTYTSQGRTKRNNRRAELLLREAEWLDAWAAALGAPSRREELDAAWRTVLLNQFHDILPGSSVALVYVESERQFAAVHRTAEAVRDAQGAFVMTNDQRSTTNDQRSAGPEQVGAGSERAGNPSFVVRRSSFVVFNSLPWDRTEAVAIPLADGQQTPELGSETQVVETFDSAKELLVEATVPSYGFAPLATESRATNVHRSSFTVHRSAMANDELRLELDDHGEVALLYDVRHNRQVVLPGSSANQLVLYEDRPLNWDAWDIDPFYEEKPYPLREIVDWRVVEEGPLRAAVQITRRFGRSTLRQRICLWRNSRRIDFMTEVDWQERQMLLRALFPLQVNASRATCEIQFGAVERPTHRNTSWDWARFEVCAHKWVDLSEGGYGVALMNDGKYGHSLHNTTLGLSLLKSAIHPDPEADRGLHRFTYSLLPHAGDWRVGQVVRRAYELNAPLRAVTTNDQQPTTNDPGIRALGVGRSSFVQVDADHVIVETIKVADDGDGLIVRMYEAHNQRGTARLTFARPVASAVEVDLLEREAGPAAVEGASILVRLRPFEVKTLRVRLQ